MNKLQLIETLTELLENEHPGCDDNTCLINSEMMERYPVRVAEDFSSSGAASTKFQRLTSKLISKYKPGIIERQCRKICKEIPHMTCDKCNAVAWDIHGDYSEGDQVTCASCLNSLNWKGE